MNQEQYLKNLSVPTGKVDVILDTDTFNEIDDQFALSYLLLSGEKLRTRAICAAPFLNQHSTSPADGMRRSYDEILKLLALLKTDLPVFHGSESYLADEKTPVISDAARVIADTAAEYSPENPLYVVAIGAITNVASAILLAPEVMRENTVIVWLGGHARDWPDTKEFNLIQDVAAARVVFGCGAPVVQLPCNGVVSEFRTTRPELESRLVGKNPLADYLATNTIREVETSRYFVPGKAWSRIIWDVTAVAWLLNDGNRFLSSYTVPSPLVQYDGHYSFVQNRHLITYVYQVKRDNLFTDLFQKLTATEHL